MCERLKKKMTFEENILRLGEIVQQMEKGELTLEESLKLFQEGNALIKNCHGQLERAKLKVTTVSEDITTGEQQ